MEQSYFDLLTEEVIQSEPKQGKQPTKSKPYKQRQRALLDRA